MNYSCSSISSFEFKAALSIYIHASPQQPEKGFISTLQQNLLVELLFQREVLQGSKTLFLISRFYLVLICSSYEMALGSDRLPRKISHWFFTDEKEQQYAIACLENLRQLVAGTYITLQMRQPVADINNVLIANQHQVDVIAHQEQSRMRKWWRIIFPSDFKKKKNFLESLVKSSAEALRIIVTPSVTTVSAMNRSWSVSKLLLEREAKQFSRSYVQCTSGWYQISAVKTVAKFNNISLQTSKQS